IVPVPNTTRRVLRSPPGLFVSVTLVLSGRQPAALLPWNSRISVGPPFSAATPITPPGPPKTARLSAPLSVIGGWRTTLACEVPSSSQVSVKVPTISLVSGLLSSAFPLNTPFLLLEDLASKQNTSELAAKL